MFKRSATAFGLLCTALAFFATSSPAAAACDCKTNAQCGTGYVCKPVPGGCGSGTLTGWCTALGKKKSGVAPSEQPFNRLRALASRPTSSPVR